MEENKVIPQEAQLLPADAAQQFSTLAQRLLEQLEKHAQESDARQEQMDLREQELSRREMAAKARRLLAERGLPEELADCLSFREEEEISSAADALEKAFRGAVQQAIEARLSADAPRTGAAARPLDQLSDEEYYAAVCRSN